MPRPSPVAKLVEAIAVVFAIGLIVLVVYKRPTRAFIFAPVYSYQLEILDDPNVLLLKPLKLRALHSHVPPSREQNVKCDD
jgi:hypothetical protein